MRNSPRPFGVISATKSSTAVCSKPFSRTTSATRSSAETLWVRHPLQSYVVKQITISGRGCVMFSKPCAPWEGGYVLHLQNMTSPHPLERIQHMPANPPCQTTEVRLHYGTSYNDERTRSTQKAYSLFVVSDPASLGKWMSWKGMVVFVGAGRGFGVLGR